MRVLIIDDSKHFRLLVKHTLNKAWPDVIVDEYDPIQLGKPDVNFNWNKYQILLLDYQLGTSENGLQWFAEFKQEHFPVTIMLTGEGNETLAVKAMKLGIEDYLRKKGLSRHGLLNTIKDAYEAYYGAMDAVSSEPLDIAVAIKGKHLHNYYQPIMAMGANPEFEFYQVLPRMINDDGEVISAKQLLLQVATHKQIQLLDRWVVRESLCYNIRLQLQQQRNIRFLLNIDSASLLNPSFVDWFGRLIEHSRQSTAQNALIFAVDFEHNLYDRQKALPLINILRKKYNLQFLLAGFEPESYQQQWLDQPFFSMVKLAHDQIKHAVRLKQVIEQLKAKHFKVIVPFIENASQMSVAVSANADYLQGYFIDIPKAHIEEDKALIEEVELTDYIKPF